MSENMQSDASFALTKAKELQTSVAEITSADISPSGYTNLSAQAKAQSAFSLVEASGVSHAAALDELATNLQSIAKNFKALDESGANALASL